MENIDGVGTPSSQIKLRLPELEFCHPELELHFQQLNWKRDAGIPIPATSGC
ncbi:MAG: hypothetical protein WBI53_03790 [Paludibacter sp.]